MQHVIPGFEKRKVTIDLLKHFATLSVACIALVASFYQQIKLIPNYQEFLFSSVAAFFICVCATVISCLLLLANIENVVAIAGTIKHQLIRLSILTVLGSFLFGLWQLSQLVLSNAL